MEVLTGRHYVGVFARTAQSSSLDRPFEKIMHNIKIVAVHKNS